MLFIGNNWKWARGRAAFVLETETFIAKIFREQSVYLIS